LACELAQPLGGANGWPSKTSLVRRSSQGQASLASTGRISTMKVLRAILLIGTAAFFLLFAFNIRVLGWSSRNGYQIESYNGWSRFAPLLLSAFSGVWYCGLKAKTLWAWRLGLIVFLGLIVLIAIKRVEQWLHPGSLSDRPYYLVNGIADPTLLFVIYWSWWRPKRPEFMKRRAAPRRSPRTRESSTGRHR
jgi:hypothetical protein